MIYINIYFICFFFFFLKIFFVNRVIFVIFALRLILYFQYDNYNIMFKLLKYNILFHYIEKYKLIIIIIIYRNK